MELDPGVYLRINEITTFTPPDFLTLSLTCFSRHYVHLAGRSLLVQEGWAESRVVSCWDAPHSYWSPVPRGNQTTFKVKVLQEAWRRSCSWQRSLVSQGGYCPRAVLLKTCVGVLSFKSVHLKGMLQPSQVTEVTGALACILAEDKRVHLDKVRDGRSENSCLSPVHGLASASLSLHNFSICFLLKLINNLQQYYLPIN